MFDKNHDGMLAIPELKDFLQSKGEPLSDEELNSIFSYVDLDGNGKIDMNEFLKLVDLFSYFSHYKLTNYAIIKLDVKVNQIHFIKFHFFCKKKTEKQKKDIVL